MKKNISISLGLIFLFITTILYLFINKLTSPRILSNDELLINGFYQHAKPIPISNFLLERADGSFFTKDHLVGKWTIMYFGFTNCPDECPITMSELRKLITTLREKNFPLDDKQWILVSIDPSRDSVEDINLYATRFDSSFEGLRADSANLLSLSTQLKVAKNSPMNHMNHDDQLNNHVNNIIMINPNGDYFGFFRPPFNLTRLSLTYQSITSK